MVNDNPPEQEGKERVMNDNKLIKELEDQIEILEKENEDLTTRLEEVESNIDDIYSILKNGGLDTDYDS